MIRDSPFTALSLLPTICLATNAAILLSFFLLSRYTYENLRALFQVERLNLEIHKQIMWLVVRSDFQEALQQPLKQYFLMTVQSSPHKVLFYVLITREGGKKSMTIAKVTN